MRYRNTFKPIMADDHDYGLLCPVCGEPNERYAHPRYDLTTLCETCMVPEFDWDSERVHCLLTLLSCEPETELRGWVV